MRLLSRATFLSVFLLTLASGLLNAQTDRDAPGFDERSGERERMVERTIARRGVSDPDVLRAMKTVPRHEFVPDESQRLAYADRALPIGFGQTISQPLIVAYMTEVLGVEKGHKVLEIGTGSGYQAAVLAEITDRVYTVEIIGELAVTARRRLNRLGYTGVEVLNDDGYYGWEKHAPYDRIIVTAAAGHVPPPLVDQLVAGGRIIIPIGGIYQTQNLTLIRKGADGEITTEQLLPVRFVPFTGEAQE